MQILKAALKHIVYNFNPIQVKVQSWKYHILQLGIMNGHAEFLENGKCCNRKLEPGSTETFTLRNRCDVGPQPRSSVDQAFRQWCNTQREEVLQLLRGNI